MGLYLATPVAICRKTCVLLISTARLSAQAAKMISLAVIGFIVLALAVMFLGQPIATFESDTLLNYGGGIALVVAALAFFMRQCDKAGTKILNLKNEPTSGQRNKGTILRQAAICTQSVSFKSKKISSANIQLRLGESKMVVRHGSDA